MQTNFTQDQEEYLKKCMEKKLAEIYSNGQEVTKEQKDVNKTLVDDTKELVVVMLQGRKSKETIKAELNPFLEAENACNFVDWLWETIEAIKDIPKDTKSTDSGVSSKKRFNDSNRLLDVALRPIRGPKSRSTSNHSPPKDTPKSSHHMDMLPQNSENEQRKPEPETTQRHTHTKSDRVEREKNGKSGPGTTTSATTVTVRDDVTTDGRRDPEDRRLKRKEIRRMDDDRRDEKRTRTWSDERTVMVEPKSDRRSDRNSERKIIRTENKSGTEWPNFVITVSDTTPVTEPPVKRRRTNDESVVVRVFQQNHESSHPVSSPKEKRPTDPQPPPNSNRTIYKFSVEQPSATPKHPEVLQKIEKNPNHLDTSGTTTNDGTAELEEKKPEDVAVHPSPKAENLKRCVYFPYCSKEGCPFFHPKEPCKSPLLCAYGPLQCRYIHPQCKFGSRCSRPDCAFSHPKESMIDCKSGFSCTSKETCPYRHPPEACFFGHRCRNLGYCMFSHSGPCQYGAACRLPGCTFSHKSTQNPVQVDNAELEALSSTLPKTPPQQPEEDKNPKIEETQEQLPEGVNETKTEELEWKSDKVDLLV